MGDKSSESEKDENSKKPQMVRFNWNFGTMEGVPENFDVENPGTAGNIDTTPDSQPQTNTEPQAQENTTNSNGKKKKKKKKTALSTCVFPAIRKLADDAKDETVANALSELKLSLTNAEQNKPGITDKLIAHIIENIKRQR